MKIKKISIFFCFIILLIIGYLCLQIIPPLLYDDHDCPQYINDFVKLNPQAQELKINYQSTENDEPITLDIDENIPLFIQWDKRWAYTRYGDEIVGTAPPLRGNT